ncbi:MAG: hydrogenase maturation protease [Desulfurococcales archaeon ex4484_58]|nr:MAG: hydrogenase maturation protease [Desulfurococcales archaeon ex4484_58]
MFLSSIDTLKLLEKLLCIDKASIVCIGSPLRADDQAGLIVCDELLNKGYDVIKCEYGLENCILELTEKKPSKIIIVDGIVSDKLSPGEVVLVSEDEIVEQNISLVTTHNIPINTTTAILRNVIGLKEYYLLGIRVKNIDIGLEVSEEVKNAVEEVVKTIEGILGKCSEVKAMDKGSS